MAILNLGSLNIDRVFRVPRIVRPGETTASISQQAFAGGKGANQSVALARAGAQVAHAGRIGPDGHWLLTKLESDGIDTSRVVIGDGPTGQAIIQVDAAGQNAIFLLSGENLAIRCPDVDAMLFGWGGDDWLLVQNETNCVDHAIAQARRRGMQVAFNPAPFDTRVLRYPIELVDLLCLNETEGAAMTGESDAKQIVAALSDRWPNCQILLTLGAEGVLYHGHGSTIRVGGCPVAAVDTTAAGDTFLGYFLAAHDRRANLRSNLELACRAAALCVTRHGALDSIPRLEEVLRFD